MLTRWTSVANDDQRVTFAYIRREDYDAVVQAHADRFSNLRDRWRVVGRTDSPERRAVEPELTKLTLEANYANTLKDLEDIRVVAALYKCFLRAKEAAEKSARDFENMRFSGLRKSRHRLRILNTHFAGATKDHIDKIVETFRQTATGLGGNVTLADCAGRERVGTILAEGIVPLKPQFQQAMVNDAQRLDRIYGRTYRREQEGPLRHIYQKHLDQQFLMHRYLVLGDTENIHVEYSFIDQYSVDAMARIILHEATHKFAATADFAYVSADQVRHLKPEQAILNADSYAYAGMSILKNQVVDTAALNSETPTASASVGEAPLANRNVEHGDLDAQGQVVANVG